MEEGNWGRGVGHRRSSNNFGGYILHIPSFLFLGVLFLRVAHLAALEAGKRQEEIIFHVKERRSLARVRFLGQAVVISYLLRFLTDRNGGKINVGKR